VSDFGTVFGLIVGLPAIVLAVVAATKHELAGYARRLLVVYAALVIAALAGLVAQATGNPVILYTGLIAAVIVNMAGGPFSLAVSAFCLFVFLILGMTMALPFSIWAPAIVVVSCLFALVRDIASGAHARQ
jgi:hypothetical protein